MPKRVLKRWREIASEAVLVGIVADLDRHGVSGRLDLYALPEVPSRPLGIGVIDASLRIAGQREPGPGRARWSADRDAFERVVEAATHSCLRARPDKAVTLSSGALPTMLVRRADSPYERVRAVLYRDFLTRFGSVGDDRFRTVAVSPDHGRVSLPRLPGQAAERRSVEHDRAPRRSRSCSTTAGSSRTSSSATAVRSWRGSGAPPCSSSIRDAVDRG